MNERRSVIHVQFGIGVLRVNHSRTNSIFREIRFSARCYRTPIYVARAADRRVNLKGNSLINLIVEIEMHFFLIALDFYFSDNNNSDI